MSDYAKVAASQLPEAVNVVLAEYYKEFRVEVDAMTQKSANRCRDILKATSPRGAESKHYADGWTVKQDGSGVSKAFIVHNRTKPGLAHLLNNGHVAANQYGTYGFVAGDGHIDKAEKEAVDYLIEQLKGAGAL